MRAEKITLLIAVAGILLFGWLLVGCEGEQGPAGPPGPGLSGEALYAGDDANTCGHCHDNLVESWHGTGHSEAWAALGADTTNNYCLQCHTTGFDDVYDHNGNRVSSGVNNGGYDDTRDPKLRNVQCEACHGPMGVNPAAHTPMLAANFSGTSCAKCHGQPDEWATSGHGTVLSRMTREEFADEWGGSSCKACHISEGFIAKYDSVDHAGLTFDGETANMVGCATCHDAHAADNEAQLRTLADATSPYGGEEFPDGYAITGFGKGQLCVQCHHARRSRSSIQGQFNNGSAHPGPHESPQADMVSGRGSWELPGEYNRNNPHAALTNKCVDCHMYSIPMGQTGGPLYGHSFAPDLRKCQTCHTGATDFDINGIQTEIEAKLEELAALLPQDGDGHVMAEMDTINWTREQREAGYVYLFVEGDGSKGVHHSRYADSLLTNAIRYLSPGAFTQRQTGVRG